MPISGPDIVLYEKKDKIVTITINRPERRNAISLELAARLGEAWTKFRDDEDAWVAILTGAGDKAFCAGLDLIEQAGGDSGSERRGGARRGKMALPPCTPLDFDIWKPVIAAINGYAVAGGFLFAQHCDIRIAAEHAEFGIAETRWNMPAYWIVDLTRQIGLGHALEIALWGDGRMTAQRGYEIGWINRVVPQDKLMEEAFSWAERMLYLAPRCVRNLKEILYRGFYLPPSEGLAFALALEQNLAGMEDTIEGPRAFAEKRKPTFKNR